MVLVSVPFSPYHATRTLFRREPSWSRAAIGQAAVVDKSGKAASTILPDSIGHTWYSLILHDIHVLEIFANNADAFAKWASNCLSSGTTFACRSTMLRKRRHRVYSAECGSHCRLVWQSIVRCAIRPDGRAGDFQLPISNIPRTNLPVLVLRRRGR